MAIKAELPPNEAKNPLSPYALQKPTGEQYTRLVTYASWVPMRGPNIARPRMYAR